MQTTNETKTETAATRWDALDVAGRLAVLKRDRSMRDPRWASLRRTMAGRAYFELTLLQRGAVDHLLGGGR